MPTHNANLSGYLIIKGIIIVFLYTACLLVQKCYSSSTNVDKDTSGTILICFEKFYYQVKNEGIYKKIDAPSGINSEDFYRKLNHIERCNNDTALLKASDRIRDLKSKTMIPIRSLENYSFNPTAEYAIEIGKGSIGSNIHKEVFNIVTGDTLIVITSDWSINFSALRYAWSPDGKWLAMAKDDKRGDEKSGSSLLIVNLAEKIIKHYKVDEHIEEIIWNPQSSEVAILTEEWLRARTIWNYIIPMAWIQPQTVRSFYLYVVKTNVGIIRKVEIAHRIDEISSYGIFWIE